MEVTGDGAVDIVVPSYLMVMVDEGAKFEPVTVTVVPTGPEFGLNVIVGAALGIGGGGYVEANWFPLPVMNVIANMSVLLHGGATEDGLNPVSMTFVLPGLMV